MCPSATAELSRQLSEKVLRLSSGQKKKSSQTFKWSGTGQEKWRKAWKFVNKKLRKLLTVHVYPQRDGLRREWVMISKSLAGQYGVVVVTGESRYVQRVLDPEQGRFVDTWGGGRLRWIVLTMGMFTIWWLLFGWTVRSRTNGVLNRVRFINHSLVQVPSGWRKRKFNWQLCNLDYVTRVSDSTRSFIEDIFQIHF